MLRRQQIRQKLQYTRANPLGLALVINKSLYTGGKVYGKSQDLQ